MNKESFLTNIDSYFTKYNDLKKNINIFDLETVLIYGSCHYGTIREGLDYIAKEYLNNRLEKLEELLENKG